MEIPEFTCVCPMTGQPDFAHFLIEIVADELCVETKSLKQYFWSYRNEGAFHEKVTNTILDSLGVILRRGAEEGVFRAGLEPLDVHLLISSFCFYRVSNRQTFGEIFQIDLSDEVIKQRHRQMVCESVLRYLQA